MLLKYKQIQLELECINKDEKLALSSKEENVQEDAKALHCEDQTSTENASITKDSSKEVAPEEKTQVKTFQAFELKPLRQKLTLPGDKNRMKRVKDGTKQLSLKSSTTDASQGNGIAVRVRSVKYVLFLKSVWSQQFKCASVLRRIPIFYQFFFCTFIIGLIIT